jgi:acetylornithine deacetylase/succinyl-diaminopimelate desuccinylase-like protein
MDFLERIEEQRDELVRMLRELVAFPSVQGDPNEGAPFGVGVRQA